MTELELHHRPGPVDDGHLLAWAESARAAAGIAKSLARTPFVPATLRDRDPDTTVGNITAAILTGTELGLTPMAALRSIDVINGTPTLRAIALRALVLSAGHELVVEESTKTRAIVRGRRRGSDEWQRSVWTIDRARDYGVAGNDNWRRQPTAMLIARATAECARLIAADVLLAVPYIAEELQDDGAAEDPPAADLGPPGRRTAQRRRRPVNAPPPPTPGVAATSSVDMAAAVPTEDNPPLEETTPPDMITKEQRTALQAGFTNLGIRNRQQRLDTTRDIIGRTIESANDLYRAEASTVIDELHRRRTALAQADEDAALELAYEAEHNHSSDEPDPDVTT